MKAIARSVAVVVAAGSFLTMTACGGSAPAATDATEATEGGDEPAADGEKKPLEGMKGNRMEKADAEE